MGNTIQYLLEFRKRFICCLLVITIVFVVFAFVANQIYQLMALPLLQHLTGRSAIIATSVTAPFLVPFKAAFFAAIYITMPYSLYQLWCFIGPALYRHEKRSLWWLLITSSLLFYLGTLFAYFIVLPWVFRFFIGVAPTSVMVMPEIGHYLHFMTQLLLAFGLAFELPIMMLVTIRLNIFTRQQLQQQRAYVIVLAFVVGMLLTPPDVISQTMLAVPLWLLYEFGLLLARVWQPFHLDDKRII